MCHLFPSFVPPLPLFWLFLNICSCEPLCPTAISLSDSTSIAQQHLIQLIATLYLKIKLVLSIVSIYFIFKFQISVIWTLEWAVHA